MQPRMKPNTCQSDESLRDLVLNSPEEGWNALLLKYGPFVKRLVRRYRLSTEDTEEIVQEVWFRLVKNEQKLIRHWDPARCSLKGYLAVVTPSVALDFIRSRFHQDTCRRAESADWQAWDVLSELLVSSSPSPASRLERAQEMEALAQSLSDWADSGRLREEDRLILELLLRGLDYPEISLFLGITEKKLNLRIYRLKRIWKRRVKGQSAGDERD